MKMVVRNVEIDNKVDQLIELTVGKGETVEISITGGPVPPESRYALLLARGSLRRIEADEMVHFWRRDRSQLSEHTWLPGGILDVQPVTATQ